jgi:hypothetical protein
MYTFEAIRLRNNAASKDGLPMPTTALQQLHFAFLIIIHE